MKGRSKRASGGVNQMAQDMSKKNDRFTFQSKVDEEAEERKRGGKTVGKVAGERAKMSAARKPRKSGGRAGSDNNPMSSAAKGTAPAGRNVSGSLT
jgi:hypothetical protein